MNTDLLARLLDLFAGSGYQVQHETDGAHGRVTLLNPDAAAENGFFYEMNDHGRQGIVDDLLDHYADTDVAASFLVEPVAAIGPSGVQGAGPVASASCVG